MAAVAVVIARAAATVVAIRVAVHRTVVAVATRPVDTAATRITVDR